MEESDWSCNNEDHNDYDEMTLMTKEMEEYINRSVEESGRSCNNDVDHDEYDDTDALMTMEMKSRRLPV